MRVGKQVKFAEVETFPNVFQPLFNDIFNKDWESKGKWNQEIFKNDNPIVLELGCGRGEYCLGMGRVFPNVNFIGIDIKGERLWKGGKIALNENLDNIRFLRAKIDFIENFFAKNEVDEIWLTFSDPQPNKPRKRLTSKIFIDKYAQFLKPKGIIHVKTDSDLLWEFTTDEIKEHGYKPIQMIPNLYGEELNKMDSQTQEILSIKTHYENLFEKKGHVIKYGKFQID